MGWIEFADRLRFGAWLISTIEGLAGRIHAIDGGEWIDWLRPFGLVARLTMRRSQRGVGWDEARQRAQPRVTLSRASPSLLPIYQWHPRATMATLQS